MRDFGYACILMLSISVSTCVWGHYIAGIPPQVLAGMQILLVAQFVLLVVILVALSVFRSITVRH